MPAPLIAITMDAQSTASQSVHSSQPLFKVKQAYAQALQDYAAAPIFIPFGDSQMVSFYADKADGLMMIGSGSHINPKHYGETAIREDLELNDSRTDYELELCQAFLSIDKPILGICGGHQTLAVVTGGSLYQDIRLQIDGVAEHEQKHMGIPYGKPAHRISIEADSQLAKAIGATELAVNTSHTQAVKTLGTGMRAVAVCDDDGVIEAIESTEHRFAMGVQWHPEFRFQAADEALFKAFIEACQE